MTDNNNNNFEIPSTLSSVTVRTMESDVESMRASGGIHPTAEVLNTTSAEEAKAEIAPAPPIPQPKEEQVTISPSEPVKKRSLAWLWWMLGLVGLFLIGYYVLPMVMK